MNNDLYRIPMPFGKELLLPTEAGKVRALGYSLKGPEALPLFVDMA